MKSRAEVISVWHSDCRKYPTLLFDPLFSCLRQFLLSLLRAESLDRRK